MIMLNDTKWRVQLLFLYQLLVNKYVLRYCPFLVSSLKAISSVFLRAYVQYPSICDANQWLSSVVFDFVPWLWREVTRTGFWMSRCWRHLPFRFPDRGDICHLRFRMWMMPHTTVYINMILDDTMPEKPCPSDTMRHLSLSRVGT